jgi:hypothetical protein
MKLKLLWKMEKEIKRVDLKWSRNEWSKLHIHGHLHTSKKKKKKNKLFLLFKGILLRPNTFQNSTNSTFITNQIGLFIAWIDSKNLDAWRFFSIFKFIYL